MKVPHLSEGHRKWAYGVVIAALGVLAYHGVMDLDGVAMWTVLAAAALGIPAQGLALANVGAEPEGYTGKHRL